MGLQLLEVVTDRAPQSVPQNQIFAERIVADDLLLQRTNKNIEFNI